MDPPTARKEKMDRVLAPGRRGIEDFIHSRSLVWRVVFPSACHGGTQEGGGNYPNNVDLGCIHTDVHFVFREVGSVFYGHSLAMRNEK